MMGGIIGCSIYIWSSDIVVKEIFQYETYDVYHAYNLIYLRLNKGLRP